MLFVMISSALQNAEMEFLKMVKNAMMAISSIMMVAVLVATWKIPFAVMASSNSAKNVMTAT
jgi:hypothetical protein